VAYEPAQHVALTTSYPALPAPAQVALLSDTFALAQAGRLPMAAYLDLLVALPRVQGPGRAALFAQARAGLDFLALSLVGTPAEAPLFAAARALLAPELDAVGLLPRAGEDSETEALRSSLIRQLARFDDPTTIERARALFDADEAGRAPLPAAIRAAVMNATGRHADAPRFAQLMARLKKAQSEEDRWLIARAIAGTRDPVLARQVMDLSLQADLPNNVAPWLPGMVSNEPAHAAVAYAFVVDHWGQLAEKLGDISGARVWLLPDASESFNDPAAAQRLVADQERLAGGPGAAPASQAAVQIELRSVIRARESERLGKALEAMPGRMRSGL
jgi:aminopeptidase N